MKTVNISMPLFVMLPRKTIDDKKFIINLNYYMHWQHFLINQIKKEYTEIAKPLLKGLEFTLPVKLRFTLWKGSNRRVDRANPLCIHEKFWADAMVKCGCIPDDNDDYIHSTHYYSGGIDRLNPRVDIEMKEIEV